MLAIEDLKNLATINGPCLTILEPVRDPVLQVTKATTRLIAAAQEADDLLATKGFTEEERENFLAPVRKFATNTDWTGRAGSVAIFRAPGFTQATFWPDVLEPQIHLAEHFQVLPLLAGMTAERNYWVLTLSINNIHLFRGTGDAFTEHELPADLPRSLADFMGFDKPDHDLESRSTKGPSSGPNSGSEFGVRFGTMSVPEREAAHLHDYFRTINRVLLPILGREGGDPLVLVAVPRELALYRAVNTYAPLVEDAIHGNVHAMGFERIHKEALELIAAHGLRKTEVWERELDTAAGRKLLLTDLDEIARAASYGQVWRFYFNREVAAARTPQPDTRAMVNRIALTVLNNSGAVICCEGKVPEGGAAAILRYRTPEEAARPELATTIK
ncbi:MAG TPA: hypothetical protein VEF06_06580 [Bryobacteraceae bacterium]|nr:hypothetical protein [Bryobacteraceae bacterium]